jgi:WD40 repeat protein
MLTSALACLQAQDTPPPAAAPLDIPKLIEQLGDPHVRVRDAAEAQLQAHPECAEALQKALPGHERDELGLRTNKLLKFFQEHLWSVQEEKLVNGSAGGMTLLRTATADSTGKQVAAMFAKGASLWEFNPLTQVRTTGDATPVEGSGWLGVRRAIAISPDGKWVASSNDRGELLIDQWDGTRVRTIYLEDAPTIVKSGSGTMTFSGNISGTGGSITVASRVFRVAPDFLLTGQEEGAAPVEAKEVLASYGANFDAPGVDVTFLATSNRLVVKNTLEQLDVIEGIVAAINNGTPPPKVAKAVKAVPAPAAVADPFASVQLTPAADPFGAPPPAASNSGNPFASKGTSGSRIVLDQPPTAPTSDAEKKVLDHSTRRSTKGVIWGLGFLPDGKRIVFANEKDGVVVFDLEKNTFRSKPVGTMLPRSMAISKDGKTIALGVDPEGLSSRLWLLETETLTLLQDVNINRTPNGVAINADGSEALFALLDGRIGAVSRATGAVTRVGQFRMQAMSVTYSTDGASILATSMDPTAPLKIWDTKSRQEIWTSQSFAQGFHSVVSLDANRFITTSNDCYLRVWQKLGTTQP